MLLWNYKQEAEAAISGDDVPVERVGPTRRQRDQHDEIVKKLGRDPAEPAFGL